MSGFKDALRSTQINQSYRNQSLDNYRMQHKHMNQRKDFQDNENKRNSLFGLLGDSVNLMGSSGKALSNFSENIKFAGDNNMNFSFMDALKGKGGFSGEGVPNMSLNQLGQTRGLMNYNQAIGGSEIPLANAAAISTSANPYLGLMAYTKQALDAATNKKASDSPAEVIEELTGVNLPTNDPSIRSEEESEYLDSIHNPDGTYNMNSSFFKKGTENNVFSHLGGS